MMETLEEAINRAARELPWGYTVSIQVELGAGWVDLFGPDDGAVEGIDADGLVDQINEAVDVALRNSTGAVE